MYLGGRFHEHYKMKTCVKVRDNIVKYDYNKPWDPWDYDIGAFGYIINRQCCELFLKAFQQFIQKPDFKFMPDDSDIGTSKVVRSANHF